MLLTRKKITPKYSQSINQIINNDLLSEIKQISGKAGKDGRSITSVRLHARVLFFDYSDGTTAKIPLSFPAGDISNPGFAGGGMEPPVKDIRAGENVEVTETNGKYIISALPNAGVYNWIDYVTGTRH